MKSCLAKLQNLFDNGVEDEDMACGKRYGEIEEIIDAVERAFQHFENFSILPNPPIDHYFILNKVTKFDNSKSTLIEQIKREWKVLRICLAKSSIYVRTYEERPDLMRAAMVGPEGTPYNRGLFFFDIRFPANYRTQPPELFYRSFDHYLDPNLSRNRKSNFVPRNGNKGLLNFRKNSCATQMTILEVLTTIQDSFFIRKPDEILRVTTSGEEYYQQVLKQTSEIMLCTLKSPPQNFEIFVQGYFRIKAHQILMNYKSRIVHDETTTRLFFKLIRAFEANGTYCKHHYNKDSYDQALLEETLHEPKSLNSSNTGKISTAFQVLFS